MIRDIDFSTPTREAAEELIALCEKAGWTVDREKDVFHYEKGVPFEDYVPETTYTSVIAHKPDFDYGELGEIYAKADQIAAKVEGAEVTGGGTAFGDDEAVKVAVTARDDLASIIYRVNNPLYGDYGSHVETAQAILAAGWTPPPRVFLEGDEIPCHLPVINNYGEVNSDHTDFEEGDGEVYTANYDVVEFNVQWAAAIQRERERRGVKNPRAHLAEED